MMSELIASSSPKHWRTSTLGELCADRGAGIFVGADKAASSKNARLELRAGDIVCTRRGDVGRTRLIGANEHSNLCTDSLLLLRTPPRRIDSQYLLHYLRRAEVRSWLNRRATGATMKHLNKSIVSSLPIVVPPLEEQRRIADVLAPFEAKQFLLERMSQTLRQFAAAIHRSIVTNGAGAPSHVVADLCDRIENGRTPDRSNSAYWNPASIPWLTSGEINGDVIVSTRECISQDGLTRCYLKRWPRNTTVVALFGSTVGQVSRLAIESCANQACCGLVPQPGYEALLFLHFSSAAQKLRKCTKGAVIEGLSRNILSDFPITVPSAHDLQRLNECVEPIFEKLAANRHQSDVLARLRDALSAKLFSGELPAARPGRKRRPVSGRIALPAGV